MYQYTLYHTNHYLSKIDLWLRRMSFRPSVSQLLRLQPSSHCLFCRDARVYPSSICSTLSLVHSLSPIYFRYRTLANQPASKAIELYHKFYSQKLTTARAITHFWQDGWYAESHLIARDRYNHWFSRRGCIGKWEFHCHQEIKKPRSSRYFSWDLESGLPWHHQRTKPVTTRTHW